MNDRPKIFCIVAARPNFMKVAPILAEIERRGKLEAVLVHTGQHYDANMSDIFFRDLGIRDPDVHLGIGSGTHAEQTGNLMIAFEALLEQAKPAMILVVGDVNATVACSLVASKLCVPVAHVEAGLRSGDRCMPEEINRIVTDQLSDLLFTTSRDANENLEREGISKKKIHFCGNVMVDSLLANINKTDPAEIITRVLPDSCRNQKFAVLTMHRPSNVDHPDMLEKWLNAFEKIAHRVTLVCPLHPRARKQLERFGFMDRFTKVVAATEPLGYLEFAGMVSKAQFVITDSGGLQEETTVLGVPCLTIRDTTERPVTILQGTNRLIPSVGDQLVLAVEEILNGRFASTGRLPDLWDGKAAQRIVPILEKSL